MGKRLKPVLSMEDDRFRVGFQGSHDYFEIVVEDDGTLSVRGHDGRLIVRPVVSNMINIELERH